jgi:hypothetical protein
VKPPTPKGGGLPASRPLSGALAGLACYNIRDLATVLVWFSRDAL